jgi:myosin heavy subunit
VTGKTTVEYFFDPSLELRKSGSSHDAPSSSFKTPSKAASSSASVGGEDAKFFNSKYLFMPCTIIKPLDEENTKGSVVSGQPYPGPTLVKTTDGTLHKITDSTRLVALHSPDDYVGVEDVLHLPQVTEASLLNTLRTRYRRDDIYTSAGPILISINPYKNVSLEGQSLYSDEQMMLYRVKGGIDTDRKPPHLFQIADRAYTALMESIHSSSAASHVDDEDAVSLLEHHVPHGSLRNQSILVSGESGAGKTEATKIIMKYLARITRKPDRPESMLSPDGKMIAALEDRVLSSNPLLETFGNAQTLRNDNSSRFGKYTLIYFNMASGSITGASISKYVLCLVQLTVSFVSLAGGLNN